MLVVAPTHSGDFVGYYPALAFVQMSAVQVLGDDVIKSAALAVPFAKSTASRG